MSRLLILTVFCAVLNGDGSQPLTDAARQAPPQVAAQPGYGSSGVAGFSEVIFKDLGALSREAVAVVRGRVVDNACRWQERVIWTETRLQVEECWKGHVPDHVRIVEPGGVIPPVGMNVSVAARYRPGERVVVFLSRDVLGQWRTHGTIQGRFAIEDLSDGRLGVSFARTPPAVVAGQFGTASGHPILRGVTLERFRKHVQALAHGAKEEK